MPKVSLEKTLSSENTVAWSSHTPILSIHLVFCGKDRTWAAFHVVVDQLYFTVVICLRLSHSRFDERVHRRRLFSLQFLNYPALTRSMSSAPSHNHIKVRLNITSGCLTARFSHSGQLLDSIILCMFSLTFEEIFEG